MLFGERLLSVRKRKKISQDELAKKLGIHAPVIGRYERNEVKPSIEVAANLANALGVSLDYLVGVTDLELDNDIVEKIIAIQQLNDNDKNHILKTIDALLRDAKARVAYG
ncbi:MAG TPA: helix-turn-helix transcriptional regulator [Vicingus sp.]|nr:helix-turn-helix transcriptional regulator [Vicingus sp.]HRP58835.1 helix-turn-helix transcriptional regulator [Vicingus sp.]